MHEMNKVNKYPVFFYTVATRFNVLEGTWKFWPLNPSDTKLNFSFFVFLFFLFSFRNLFDKEMQLLKELKAKNGY